MARYSEMLLAPEEEAEKPEEAAKKPRYSDMLLAPPAKTDGFSERLEGEGRPREAPNIPLAMKAGQPVSEARNLVSLSEARRKKFAAQEREGRGTGLLPTVGGFVEDVSNVVRGQPQFLEPENRSRGEIGLTRAPNFPAAAQTGAGLTLTTDPARQIEIIKDADPGAKFDVSERGNIMVKFSNQNDFAFLNKPGLTVTDALQGLAQILQFAGGSKAAGALVKKGLLKRTGAQATAAGTVSVGQDVAAQGLGSQEPVGVVKAGLTALFGAGAELAIPAVSTLWRKLPFREGIVAADGTLTARGREAAIKAGIEPEDIAPGVLKALDDFSQRFSPKQMETVFEEIGKQARGLADEAAAPATSEAAAARAARAKEFGVDLMEPQATRDFRGLARIEEIGADAQGNTAGELVRGRVARQGQQVERAAEDVSLAGQPQRLVDDVQGAGGQLTADLRERASEVGRQVDEAYKAIRGRKAYIAADSIPEFAKATRKALRAEEAVISPDLTPGTAATLKQMGAIARKARAARERANVQGPNVRVKVRTTNAKVEFREFEKLRRQINQRIDRATQAGDKDDRFYLLTIKRELDQYLDDAFDNGLFQGDEAVLDLMKQARAKRREYGELFESRTGDAGAGRVVDKMINQDVTNQEAANWMFGASKIGETGTAVRVAKRLRAIFGKDSEQWQMLRQGALQRIIYGARPKGTQIQTPGRLSSDLKQAVEGRGKEYMQILFSPEELRQLRRFASVLDDIIPPRGATNPSGTGYTVSRVVQDATKNAMAAIGFASGGLEGGLAARAGGEVVSRGAAAVSGRKATRDVAKGLPRPTVTPLFPGAQISAGREGYQPFVMVPKEDGSNREPSPRTQTR